ncbi:unnamed protein product [Vitrella brassicaformis CCMP3155]|uniref:Uncharacterized protein n=2 Tax=Vitrella brassicaformis TaxID=1169539 RepID=A0A0G4G4W8_VITBC|nr:unnamed protein product [Vitrella brassicaformis CCMP3155]|eukprot:CEM23448.1 unnamed protein product [Vitrella brassicaformis CCMP3155]
MCTVANMHPDSTLSTRPEVFAKSTSIGSEWLMSSKRGNKGDSDIMSVLSITRHVHDVYKLMVHDKTFDSRIAMPKRLEVLVKQDGLIPLLQACLRYFLLLTTVSKQPPDPSNSASKKARRTSNMSTIDAMEMERRRLSYKTSYASTMFPMGRKGEWSPRTPKLSEGGSAMDPELIGEVERLGLIDEMEILREGLMKSYALMLYENHKWGSSMGSDQNFFESFVFLLSRILELSFDQKYHPLIREETQRLFRTDFFNPFKRSEGTGGRGGSASRRSSPGAADDRMSVTSTMSASPPRTMDRQSSMRKPFYVPELKEGNETIKAIVQGIWERAAMRRQKVRAAAEGYPCGVMQRDLLEGRSPLLSSTLPTIHEKMAQLEARRNLWYHDAQGGFTPRRHRIVSSLSSRSSSCTERETAVTTRRSRHVIQTGFHIPVKETPEGMSPAPSPSGPLPADSSMEPSGPSPDTSKPAHISFKAIDALFDVDEDDEDRDFDLFPSRVHLPVGRAEKAVESAALSKRPRPAVSLADEFRRVRGPKLSTTRASKAAVLLPLEAREGEGRYFDRMGLRHVWARPKGEEFAERLALERQRVRPAYRWAVGEYGGAMTAR